MKKNILFIFSVLYLGQKTYSQNVGIGTTTPNSSLDINGDVALRSSPITITSTYSYALDVNTVKQANYKLVQPILPPVGNFIIAGITAGADGRQINLYNHTGASMEIYNEEAVATAANRISTGTGTTMAVYANGTVTLRYDTAMMRWVVMAAHNYNLNYFGGDAAWSLTGNTGTTATNYIGTTDEQPLRFGVKGGSAGIIDSASGNISLGMAALRSNTNGYFNTAIGFHSIKNTVLSYNNTAVGAFTLMEGGSNCTAIGEGALRFNIGDYNVAIGGSSQSSNTTGEDNTSCGNGSLYYNSSGNDNVAIGSACLLYNTTGSKNAAVGRSALLINSTGINNTALGYSALDNNQTGNWNTCIGDNSNTSVNNLNGATALGTGAVSNADNKIVIGANVAGMVIGGYALWSNLSDGRFKNNVQENVPGLDFIKQLRPVTYTMDLDKLQHHITSQMPDSIARHYYPTNENIKKANTEIKTGFIAQEVEAIVKNGGYLFDGINVPKNPTDNYSIAYSQFVMPLVKAVQEQQAMIEQLQKQNEALLKRIEKLDTK